MGPTPNSSDRYNAQVGETKSKHDIVKGYLQAEVKLMTTPNSRDGKDRRQGTDYDKIAEKRKLAGAVGGQLNPNWVEWLMGFPLGWTDLNV